MWQTLFDVSFGILSHSVLNICSAFGFTCFWFLVEPKYSSLELPTLVVLSTDIHTQADHYFLAIEPSTSKENNNLESIIILFAKTKYNNLFGILASIRYFHLAGNRRTKYYSFRYFIWSKKVKHHLILLCVSG